MSLHHRKPSEELLRRIARNVKRLRAERKLTQTRLAEVSGVAGAYISKVETMVAHPSLASVEAIARGLNCKPRDLLDKED